MKKMKKIRVFAIITALLMCLGTVSAFATGKLDQNMSGADMTFGERFEYAMQGTITGMLMVFAVLALLYGIVTLSKVFLYDIPNRKKSKKDVAFASQQSDKTEKKVPENVIIINDTTPSTTHGDGELVAVITAAIAAAIESGEYKDEFAGGFRVVSFKRSTSGAWNRK